ncbi:FecR domain-containing protein [Methylosinus sp. Sm6]|uniref:FecR family protein n=1 Tax=Methylosinus sp. Sm6 TaxID=2866948 RepID=UPI001C99DAB9|nr:FecR domain-containing protein [Methylosinus sp. Sm6]MBY6241143.1 FecR domain-containing protein [Methylosinus sp. Sm6]
MNDGEKEPETDEAGDIAIDWFVRLRAGPLRADEKAELDAWLAEDPANATAFDDVLRMYGHLAEMRPSRPGRPARRASPRLRIAALAGAAAAAVALVASFDEIAARLRADHYAGAGERKLVTLEDGSRALLDSRSSISVRYSPAERRLSLLTGEAWFEVAPDPSRPFVVEAGGGTVTALGTAFDVALEASGARVTVTEHRVSLSSGGRSVIVDEGRQSAFEQGVAARAPEPVNVDSVTAWRRGKLIVAKKPLRDVLAAIGRYHRGFIYCVDRSICERRVSGVFGAEDALESLREIETSLGLRVIHLTSYMILLY